MATRVMVYGRDEVYTYREVADIVGVSIDAVFQAARTDVVTRVRLPHSREMYIVKDEVEALRGFGRITSKEARVKIEEVRRERGMTDEKQYNEDGTNNWVPSSELDKLVEEVRIMKERQEQIAKEQQEVIAKMDRAAEHLLSMTPKVMFKYIADNMKEPAVE